METLKDADVMEAVSVSAQIKHQQEVATEDETGIDTEVIKALSGTTKVDKKKQIHTECSHEVCDKAGKGQSPPPPPPPPPKKKKKERERKCYTTDTVTFAENAWIHQMIFINS